MRWKDRTLGAGGRPWPPWKPLGSHLEAMAASRGRRSANTCGHLHKTPVSGKPAPLWNSPSAKHAWRNRDKPFRLLPRWKSCLRHCTIRASHDAYQSKCPPNTSNAPGVGRRTIYPGAKHSRSGPPSSGDPATGLPSRVPLSTAPSPSPYPSPSPSASPSLPSLLALLHDPQHVRRAVGVTLALLGPPLALLPAPRLPLAPVPAVVAAPR